MARARENRARFPTPVLSVRPHPGESALPNAPNFWDTLAPHHWLVENNYLDVSSVRLILGDIRQPVLVVGAGQGLIVEELRRQGLRCDGIDLSARMMEYARARRGLIYDARLVAGISSAGRRRFPCTASFASTLAVQPIIHQGTQP